ncbi:hypothetical protein Tco_0236687 [Tanacetum coccineum]
MPSFIRTGNLVGESLSANLVGGTCSTLTSLFHNTSQPAYLEGANTHREDAIFEKARSMYRDGHLALDIEDESDIKRGLDAYFSDLHDFPSNGHRFRRLKLVVGPGDKSTGNATNQQEMPLEVIACIDGGVGVKIAWNSKRFGKREAASIISLDLSQTRDRMIELKPCLPREKMNDRLLKILTKALIALQRRKPLILPEGLPCMLK